MKEEIGNNESSFKSPLRDLIDDASYSRFDKRKSALYYDQYLTNGSRTKIQKQARERLVRSILEQKEGYALEDVALQNAAVCLACEYGTDYECLGPNRPNVGLRSWTRINEICATPEELTVPRYSGNPKEAAHIVKRVALEFGAFQVGITGLDKRHVYSYDCDGKEIVFEEVDEPYETDEKRVIPEKCKYVVVMLVKMPAAALSCAPFPVGSAVPWATYKRIDLLIGLMAHFIRGLGYTAIPSANDTAVNGPFAIEAGLAEQGRADKSINPEAGMLVRICKVFTDLPMELDSPKKFGVAEFCKICRRCVEACPVNTVNADTEPSFDIPGPWSNPGHKTWHGNNPSCWAYAHQTGGTCGICLYVCPWNKPNTILFRLIKGIIRRTSLLNRFFLAADKFFGYGRPMKPEKWWDMK
jgi:reductive dehalogenase